MNDLEKESLLSEVMQSSAPSALWTAGGGAFCGGRFPRVRILRRREADRQLSRGTGISASNSGAWTFRQPRNSPGPDRVSRSALAPRPWHCLFVSPSYLGSPFYSSKNEFALSMMYVVAARLRIAIFMQFFRLIAE